MKEEDILTRINTIYRTVLKQPQLIVDRDSSANNVEGWDSLNHTILMAEVQKQFQIKSKQIVYRYTLADGTYGR